MVKSRIRLPTKSDQALFHLWVCFLIRKKTERIYDREKKNHKIPIESRRKEKNRDCILSRRTHKNKNSVWEKIGWNFLVWNIPVHYSSWNFLQSAKHCNIAFITHRILKLKINFCVKRTNTYFCKDIDNFSQRSGKVEKG